VIEGRSRRKLRTVASTTPNGQHKSYSALSAYAYLLLVEHRSEAVEQLEWCEDLTLDQHSRHDCRCGPPSCARRHLKPPLLYR
jgi:hypothetical protein